jgi:5'-nucleotidase
MNILLSNDDGVHAPGLAALAQALAEVATITVVAPDRDRSGASKSLTLDRPLHPQLLLNGFFSVDGTPTDCVHLALNELMSTSPDMVIAGINAGANLGDDVLYSGTVAAAIEGRHLGKPSIAVSLVGRGDHYDTAALIVKQILAGAHRLNVPAKTILNINVPDVPFTEIKGLQLTRLGHRAPSGRPIKTQDPRGKDRYWVAGVGQMQDASEGTDFFAVKSGFVSITPLQVDMTNFDAFGEIRSWLESV